MSRNDKIILEYEKDAIADLNKTTSGYSST